MQTCVTSDHTNFGGYFEVRIIEVTDLDKRGSDNRGSTVLDCSSVPIMIQCGSCTCTCIVTLSMALCLFGNNMYMYIIDSA